jgi:hypothetical protein
MNLAQTLSTWTPTSVCIMLVLGISMVAAIWVLIINIQAKSLHELHVTKGYPDIITGNAKAVETYVRKNYGPTTPMTAKERWLFDGSEDLNCPCDPCDHNGSNSGISGRVLREDWSFQSAGLEH